MAVTLRVCVPGALFCEVYLSLVVESALFKLSSTVTFRGGCIFLVMLFNCHFSWKVHYFVKFYSHLSWQVHAGAPFGEVRLFSWQARYLVKCGMVANVRNVALFKGMLTEPLGSGLDRPRTVNDKSAVLHNFLSHFGMSFFRGRGNIW